MYIPKKILKIFHGKLGSRIIHLIERDGPVKGGPTAVTAIGAGENVVTKAKGVKVLSYVSRTFCRRQPGKVTAIDLAIREQ